MMIQSTIALTPPEPLRCHQFIEHAKLLISNSSSSLWRWYHSKSNQPDCKNPTFPEVQIRKRSQHFGICCIWDESKVSEGVAEAFNANHRGGHFELHYVSRSRSAILSRATFSGKKIPKNGTQCVAQDSKHTFYKSSHNQCVLQNEWNSCFL